VKREFTINTTFLNSYPDDTFARLESITCQIPGEIFVHLWSRLASWFL